MRSFIVRRGPVTSVLAYSVAYPYSIRQLFSLVLVLFNRHVYDGCGDHNISSAFKCLHLSLFFLLLLTLVKGGSTVLSSTSEADNENTQVLYIRIMKTVWNTSDYGDRLAGLWMLLIINAIKTQTFPSP
jgi:hypothetical protein